MVQHSLEVLVVVVAGLKLVVDYLEGEESSGPPCLILRVAGVEN